MPPSSAASPELPANLVPKSRARRTSKQLFLGARTVASLALPGACEACFYIKQECKRELPYQYRPASVLFSIDRQVKLAVHRSIEEKGDVPLWMPLIARVVGYVPGLDYRWYKHVDVKTRISLCGVPDDLLIYEDGSVGIVDYKAARFTERQKDFLPLYEAQLNVYAYLARRLGRVPGPVHDLTLIYLEARQGESLAADFAMRFRARAVPVEREEEALVPHLLREARRILDLGSVPEHRGDCQEIDRMDRLMQAQTGDPFVARFGRYSKGVCTLCSEYHLLAPDTRRCFLCVAMEEW